MSKNASIIEIKAREIQEGDRFVGFGTVRSVIVEGGTVWAEIAYPKAVNARLYAFDVDMDVHTRRGSVDNIPTDKV